MKKMQGKQVRKRTKKTQKQLEDKNETREEHLVASKLAIVKISRSKKYYLVISLSNGNSKII
jgi:hypothetical protein